MTSLRISTPHWRKWHKAMTYQIGIFCIILAIVIGISTMLFQIPVKRARNVIGLLLVVSACMVALSMVGT